MATKNDSSVIIYSSSFLIFLITPSIQSIDPRKYSSLLELSSEAEHGLDPNPEEDHPDAGDGELGPGVQDPRVEQKDHAHVLRVSAALK